MTLSKFIQVSTTKNLGHGTFEVYIVLKGGSRSTLTVDNCYTDYEAKERVFLYLTDRITNEKTIR